MARTTQLRRSLRQEAAKEPEQFSSPPLTPVAKPSRTKPKKIKAEDVSPKVKKETSAPPTPQSRRKAKANKAEVKQEDPDELPHGLGKRHRSPDAEESKPAKKAKKKGKKDPEDLAKQLNNPENKVIAEKLKAQFSNAGTAQAEAGLKTTKKGKKDTAYGHTPGSTPFPDYSRPTPEECKEVVDLLSKVHGKVHVPKEVKTGRMDVAGCGEVPHVLDALIRTRLSANTNNENSSRAFQGIVKEYGTIKDRAGREMVDWNAVRLGSQQQLFKAIERGGLANVKSKDIKRILDMVYDENQARREMLQSEGKAAPGEEETEKEKQDEIDRAEDDVISLDHVHLLSKEDAFNKLIEYPGIGAKTASCVVLFCLQRPSFAVDTHVWRLTSWLGWIPKGATRDQTFSHCEVRIPDEHKYPLHYLLIKHGKTCPKCQAKANKGKQNPDLGEDCVIEHLVKRFKHKDVSPKKANKAGGKKEKDDEDDESELSDENVDFGGEDE